MQREDDAMHAATVPIVIADEPMIVAAPVIPTTPANTVATIAGVSNRRILFEDIEYAIPQFCGDDRSHDVRDFIRVFEEVMTLTRADETFKMLALRRKLKGAASCLMFITEAMSYEGLKALLIDEFGDRLTMADAERLLRIQCSN